MPTHADAEEAVPAVGFLYPGHSAEDDYPSLERMLAAGGPPVRLRLVHTDIGEDAHRVDALLEMGSAARLADGARQLTGSGVSGVIWAASPPLRVWR